MSAKDVTELAAAFERIAFDAADEGNLPCATMAQMSAAISLKRIADALWGTDSTTGIIELLNGLESRA